MASFSAVFFTDSNNLKFSCEKKNYSEVDVASSIPIRHHVI